MCVIVCFECVWLRDGALLLLLRDRRRLHVLRSTILMNILLTIFVLILRHDYVYREVQTIVLAYNLLDTFYLLMTQSYHRPCFRQHSRIANPVLDNTVVLSTLS